MSGIATESIYICIAITFKRQLKKPLNTYLHVWLHFPDQYEIQEISKDFTLKYPFMLKYCPDRYKTFDMCKKAVGVCLLALKYFLINFINY